MSNSRGNWSSLSRMAQQWIEDDEEEQVRERRRRNRDVSTTSKVVEVIPETGSSSSQPISSDDKPSEKLLNTDQQANHQAQNEENIEPPKQHNESHKLTSTDVQETKVSATETLEVEQPKSAAEEKQKVTSKKEESQNHSKTSNNILNQTEKATSCKKESILTKPQQCLEPEGVKGALQNNQNVRRLNQKFSSWNEKDHTIKAQKPQIQETSSQNKKSLKEENIDLSDSKAQDHPIQEKKNSDTIRDPVSTNLEPQNETNTSSSHGSQSKHKTQVFVSSVKIPRRSNSSCSIKSPPPVPEAIEEEPFPESKAVKSEVSVTAVSSSNLNSQQKDSSPSSQQTSTSFVRLGPLSSSVRVKSQSEDDKDDSGFTRRSSLRLSLRSRKIEDRMEKYTSAVQRSASVRLPPSHSRGAISASDGVANKRSIFEKDDENSAKSNLSRKDLTISGSVTSRINQWSSKAQESSSTVSNIKDFKTGDVATKRMLWQQRSQSSNDTKL